MSGFGEQHIEKKRIGDFLLLLSPLWLRRVKTQVCRNIPSERFLWLLPRPPLTVCLILRQRGAVFCEVFFRGSTIGMFTRSRRDRRHTPYRL